MILLQSLAIIEAISFGQSAIIYSLRQLQCCNRQSQIWESIISEHIHTEDKAEFITKLIL